MERNAVQQHIFLGSGNHIPIEKQTEPFWTWLYFESTAMTETGCREEREKG